MTDKPRDEAEILENLRALSGAAPDPQVLARLKEFVARVGGVEQARALFEAWEEIRRAA
jgi:hypothetical protein